MNSSSMLQSRSSQDLIRFRKIDRVGKIDRVSTTTGTATSTGSIDSSASDRSRELVIAKPGDKSPPNTR
jgi:hypothetical protein